MKKYSATILSTIMLFTGFFQSDRLEHEWLSVFVEVQAVDYILQRIYINSYTLSFQGFYVR